MNPAARVLPTSPDPRIPTFILAPHGRARWSTTVGAGSSVWSRGFPTQMAAQELQEAQQQERHGHPREPVSPEHEQRPLVSSRYRHQERTEGRGVAPDFPEDPPPVVADEQRAPLGTPHDIESRLDTTHDGHVAVLDPVEIEVPGGHQHESGAGRTVATPELCEVHVLADGHPPGSARA